VHHALFLALLLLLCAPAVLPGIVCRPGRRAATAALLCCGLLSGWLLLRLWQMPVDKPRRPLELITQLSLIPGDYLAVYGHTWLAPGQAWTRAGWFVSPGVLKVMLAAVGLVWGWSARPRRRWTLWLASFFLASLLLSFGTRLDLWGWRPWLWIADWVPGFGQVRNVFRFAYFTQLTVVLLAAAGVEGAWNWLRSVTLPPTAPHDPVRHADSPPRPASQPADTHSAARWRTVTAWSVALIGVIAVFDPWPPRPQLTLPGPLAMLQSGGEDWMSVLRRDAAAPAPADAVPRRAVVCLPMAVGNDVRDFAVSTDWMLAGTRHRLPMVNGYSGFFPQNYFYWRNRLQSEEPIDETVLANLYSIGVRWLVIDPRSYPADDAETFRLGSYALTQISAADQPIRIYRLSVLQ
jgi:hypothetical protein